MELPAADRAGNPEPIHPVAAGIILPKSGSVAEIECLDLLIEVHKLDNLLRLTPVTYQVTVKSGDTKLQTQGT